FRVGETEADGLGGGEVPLLVGLAAAARVEPGDDKTVAEALAAEDRLLAAVPGELPQEIGERAALVVDRLPVEPADRVVLAIGVVVAVLAAAELVAGKQHRRAVGEQQGAEEVAFLPFAGRDDARVVGRTFLAVVEAAVVGMAVAILLAVRLVVLVVVGDQIV